jgi:hypothetical protein
MHPLRTLNTFCLAGLLLIALLLTACSQPTPRQIVYTVEVAKPASGMEAPAAPAKTEAVAAFIEKKLAESAATSAPQAAPLAPSGQQPSQGRMIIKDAAIDLLVENTDVAIDRVTTLAADQGGYLLSSKSWLTDGYRYAEMRMGVPSAVFESTLTQLRKIGMDVINEEASGQDVSSEYSDLQSRLVNLEATAARVRDFLAQAKTVEESLRINQQLSELEGQIEQVKGQMKFYEGRSAYSTITVLLTPFIPTPTPGPTDTPTPTPTPTPAWNPGSTARSAANTMIELIKITIDVLIWAVFLLWPFALVGFIVWYFYRRNRRKKQQPPPPPSQP